MCKVTEIKEMIMPTLEILCKANGKMEYSEIDKRLLKKLNVKEEEKRIKHGHRTQSEFSYRAAWARTYLKKYGVIDNPEIGYWVIKDTYSGEILDVEEIFNAYKTGKKYIPRDLPIDNIEENNKRLIRRLSNKYYQKSLSLFLGAGVSIDAGIPSWDELISKFWINRLKKEKCQVFDETLDAHLAAIEKENRDSSAISQTRFIRQNLRDEDYLELLLKSLYGTPLKEEPRLLNEICDFVKTKGSNEIRIKNIISYNFDNLLERAFEKKNIAFSMINTGMETLNPGVVNIYHVHGYLEEDASPEKIDLEKIIFSEEQYHKMYTDLYHWSNIVQISKLRETPCLFIGTSLTDPNIRRLLDVSRTKNKDKHYAIMKIEDIKIPSHLRKTDEAYQMYKDFYKHHRNDYFNSIGVQVIWVKEYDEIPKILSQIRDGMEVK